MSLRFLLDTCTVSHLYHRDFLPSYERMLAQYSQACAICSPVWHELVFGLSRLPRGKRRDKLEFFLWKTIQPAFPILNYDDVAAEWHGKERARLEKRGKPAPFVDGQIASIAVTQDLTLVTDNTKDFRSFQKLRLANWLK